MQIKSIKRELHKTSTIPGTLSKWTKLAGMGGIVQVGAVWISSLLSSSTTLGSGRHKQVDKRDMALMFQLLLDFGRDSLERLVRVLELLTRCSYSDELFEPFEFPQPAFE